MNVSLKIDNLTFEAEADSPTDAVSQALGWMGILVSAADQNKSDEAKLRLELEIMHAAYKEMKVVANKIATLRFSEMNTSSFYADIEQVESMRLQMLESINTPKENGNERADTAE